MRRFSESIGPYRFTYNKRSRVWRRFNEEAAGRPEIEGIKA